MARDSHHMQVFIHSHSLDAFQRIPLLRMGRGGFLILTKKERTTHP